jgi:2-polyprenyl-6-methoxyphenol hydroxylase-like FAD-dependent oxidoreductase
MGGEAAMANDSVLVAGGGIAGLAVARALRQRGVRALLSERTTTGSTDGLAINLPGNAITAFAHLGLRDELEKLGRPTRRRDYRKANGKLLFAIDEDEFWGPDARPRCVRRSDLFAILDEVHQDNRRPDAVASVRADADGAEATFDDGRTERHGFVVGADGVRSTVRDSILPAGQVRTAVLSAASWRFVTANPGITCWTVWSGAGGAFLAIPLDDTEVYVYASATRGGPVDPDPGWLQRTFGEYADPVRSVLAGVRGNPQSLYHSPVEEVRIDRWARGRVALAGDAAHATAPVWAQGGALAAEDALTLAESLAGGDWDTAGERYQQLRRERVRHVQAATDRFSKTAGLPIQLRDLLLPVVGPRAYRAAYGPLRNEPGNR